MNKIIVLAMSALLSMTACSKNDDTSGQVEVTNESKDVSSAPQEVQQNSELSEDKKIPEKLNTIEPDCESSPEAYQSCLTEMRDDVAISFKKSGMPIEFQGTWVVSKEQCGNEASMYSSTEISARSYNEIDNPCDINEVFMINSPEFLSLNLKCLNDYTDENSGYYNRSVTLSLDNDKLEIKSGETDTINKVRCSK